MLSIPCETVSYGTYTLFDITGKYLFSERLGNSRNINISSLESGMYLIKYFNGKRFFFGRFIKQ